VTVSGFSAKGQQEFLSEEVADLLGTIANDLDLSPVVPMGEVVAIDAEKNAEIEELAQVAYNATNPAAAEGALLDNIGLLRGIPRQPATYSTVYCSCAFTAAGTYAAGSLTGFVSSIPSQQASNVSPVVVPSTNPLNGNAVSTSNPYVTGSSYAAATQFQAPVTGPIFGDALIGANSGQIGNIGAFTGQVPVSGWLAATALSGTASVVPGSASVTFSSAQTLSQGQPITFDTTGTVYFIASNTSTSTSATLTTPFAGMVALPTAVPTILGLADLSTPSVGAYVEQDTPYRIRQQSELGAQGSCNLAAIAVDVIEALQGAPSPVAGASCQVYENTSDVIDSNGLLPHSYQVVVYDGLNPNTNQNNPLIGQAIWNNKPAGLKPYGTINVTVNDSQGVQRTVSFTRPAQRQVYMVVNATISSGSSVPQVASLIEIALINAAQGQPFVAYGATVAPVVNAPTTLLPGVDVVPQAFAGVAQAQSGVVQVTSVLCAFSPNPTSETVLQTPRGSVAVLSQVNLVVNLSVFQP